MANGAGNAVQLATKLGEVDFPEFTAALITSTFDALLKAHIHQMKTYADIIEDIAMTLDDYVKAYRNTVSDEEIDEWLENHGLPILSTSEADDNDNITITEDDKTALEETFLREGEQLNAQPIQNQGQSSSPKYSLAKDSTTDNNNTPRIGWEEIRERVAEMILARRQDLLRELVRMGLVRLVVDFGEIETRILFSVYGTSTRSRTTYEYTRKTREGRIGGRVSARGKLKKWFVKGFLGGYYQGGSVRVRTSSSYDRDTTGSRIDIFGRVYIRFKSDYAPLNLPEE